MGLGWLCLEERWPHLSHIEFVIAIGTSVPDGISGRLPLPGVHFDKGR